MLIQRLWDATKDVNAVLWPARFSIAVVAISVPFLFFLGPSQDALLAAIGQHHSIGSKLLLAVMCLLWALETFYWAYFMSRLPEPDPGARAQPEQPLLHRARVEKLNRNFQFWLGLVTLFIAAAAAAKANWGNTTSLWLIALGFIVDLALYTACTYRFGGLKLTLLIHTLLRLPWVKEWRPLVRLRAADGVHNRRDLFPLPEVPPGWVQPPRRFTEQSRVSRLVSGCMVALTILLYLAFSGHPVPTRQLVAAIISFGWLCVGGFCVYRLTSDDMPPLTKWWVTGNFALFTMIFILSLYAAPVLNGGTPSLVSAPLVMFSAFCAWVFFGTFFFALPAELFRLPVTTAVIVLALLVSTIPGDNHDVRRLDSPPDRAQLLSAAYEEWYQDATALNERHDQPLPLVIVATAGGASRAGYWTAKVLGELEAAYPGFHHYVFAVSSVSGGTVGAGLWRAMLQNDKCERQNKPENGAGDTYVNCARLFFCQDFLGPLFLDGLYADLTQRILPGRLLPDRAVALEQSWEQAWRNMMRDPQPGTTPAKAAPNPMASPFHQLVSDTKDWRPLLLINGTSEKTGRRIITSQLAIASDDFPDALDFFGATHTELNLSTALHNSARFTYLDAAGNVVVEPEKPGEVETRPDRILDGGYFENFGAATAFDLLQALYKLHSPHKFRPVIVQITSDPTLEIDGARDTDWARPLDQPPPGHWLPDLGLTTAADTLAPLLTLYDTRDAEGIRATKMLMQAVGADNYAHFRLTNPDIPISWAMSGEVIGFIDQEWTPSPAKANEAPNPNELAKATLAKIFGPMPANTVSATPNPACGGL